MSELDRTGGVGILGHLRMALKHGEGIARCYMTEIASEGEKRAAKVLRLLAWDLALSALVVTGVVLLAMGIVKLLDQYIRFAGSGLIIVGMVLIVGVVVAFFARKAGSGD